MLTPSVPAGRDDRLLLSGLAVDREGWDERVEVAVGSLL